MAYSRGNYNFVIDSSFSPLTMQEMLVPFNTYKEVFENTEKVYDDLQQKADTFKYLSKTLPEGSEARKMYEGYANDLYAKSQDFMSNGLSMGNKRGLMEMKRRYQGEIGELARADEALKKEQELRRTVAAKDPSMLYKTDNLTIDNFLNGNTPDTWSISGRELYAQAAAAGKALSSRVFSAGDGGKTLGGYFRDYVQRNGITQDQLNKFREQILNDFSSQVTVLPEFQAEAQMLLDAEGVSDNLSGDNLRRAQQQVIRGLVDGAVYTEAHNPTRDPGVMSTYERQSLDRQAAAQGLTWNDKTKSFEYSLEKDPVYQRQQKIAEWKAANGVKDDGKKTGSSGYGNLSAEPISIEFDDDPEADNAEYTTKYGDAAADSVGKIVSYENLSSGVKKVVDKILKEKNAGPENYLIEYTPFERGNFNDTEAKVRLIPMTPKRGVGGGTGEYDIEELMKEVLGN